MVDFKFIPVPTEDYDALGIGPDTVIQTSINDNGDLVVHVVTGEELEEFVCDGDCDGCPWPKPIATESACPVPVTPTVTTATTLRRKAHTNLSATGAAIFRGR